MDRRCPELTSRMFALSAAATRVCGPRCASGSSTPLSRSLSLKRAIAAAGPAVATEACWAPGGRNWARCCASAAQMMLASWPRPRTTRLARSNCLCAPTRSRRTFVRKGRLQVATSQFQQDSWEPALQLAEEHGYGKYFTRLSAEEVQQRGGSSHYIGGYWESGHAVVQPAFWRGVCAGSPSNAGLPSSRTRQ